MNRRAALLSAAILLAIATAAEAFIQAKFPLDELMKQSDQIFVVRVERFDPEKPAAVLIKFRDLKGNPDVERLPINLTGDKENHTPDLLKRLAPDLPVMVFLHRENDTSTMMLAYTNGTWFQATGTKDADRTRWAFTHCEIYLRRTFRGSTAELESVVADVLAGKRKPPPYDAKQPPGMGPEVRK